MKRLRGLLLFCMSLLLISPCALAFNWQDLFRRPDQQQARWMNQGNYLYQTKQYSQALETYSQMSGETADYNRGNALARLGKYQDAIAAYDEALKKNAHDEDAQYNRDLVTQLLQKSSNNKPPLSQNAPPKNPDQKQHQNPPPDQQNEAKQSPQEQQRWLEMIPDNPGGLLRQKFLREHARLQAEGE